MPDELTSFIIYAVEGMAAAVGVRFMFRALQRSQRHAGLMKGEAVVVGYGWVLRILALVCLVAFIGFVIAARLGGGNERVQALFLFFALMTAACVLEFCFTKLLVLPEKLERRTIWRRASDLKWKDIVSVTWSDSAQWFCLRAADGEKAYVHSMMNGIGAIADMVLKLVPQEACDSEVLARLEASRAATRGKPLRDSKTGQTRTTSEPTPIDKAR